MQSNCFVSIRNHQCNLIKYIIISKISHLHYIDGITPKRVTSGGLIYAAERLSNTAPKERRNGGNPFGTMCPI